MRLLVNAVRVAKTPLVSQERQLDACPCCRHQLMHLPIHTSLNLSAGYSGIEGPWNSVGKHAKKPLTGQSVDTPPVAASVPKQLHRRCMTSYCSSLFKCGFTLIGTREHYDNPVCGAALLATSVRSADLYTAARQPHAMPMLWLGPSRQLTQRIVAPCHNTCHTSRDPTLHGHFPEILSHVQQPQSIWQRGLVKVTFSFLRGSAFRLVAA
jgi:hypothetical protein